MLQTSTHLQTFDKLRREVKAHTETQRLENSLKVKYDNCSNAICKELIAKMEQLSTQVKDWEREYLQLHGIHPSPTCVPEHVAHAMREKRMIQKIVDHEWNIKLT